MAAIERLGYGTDQASGQLANARHVILEERLGLLYGQHDGASARLCRDHPDLGAAAVRRPREFILASATRCPLDGVPSDPPSRKATLGFRPVSRSPKGNPFS